MRIFQYIDGNYNVTHPGVASPGMYGLELAEGRNMPPTGNARRAEFTGVSGGQTASASLVGMMGMGYRHSTGPAYDVIPSAGNARRATGIYQTMSTQLGYDYCRLITIDGAMVSGGSDLTGFPVTITYQDPLLKSVANGGFVNSYDNIAFGPSCSGTSGTLYNWDTSSASWDSTNGIIVAHVATGAARVAGDTVGIYFGGSSTSTSTPTAVWSGNNYVGVYHQDISGTTSSDATGTGNTGTNLNSMTAAAGEIVNALTYNGTTDLTRLTLNSGLPITQSGSGYAFDAWMKAANGAAGNIFAETANTGTTGWFSLGCSGQKIVIFYRNTGGTQWLPNTTSTSNFCDGTWHHVAFTDNNGTAKLYLDGVLDATSFNYTRSGAYAVTNSSFGGVWRNSALFNSLAGSLDEVRLSNASAGKTADWYLTQVRNQRDPWKYIHASDLYTVPGATLPAQPRYKLEWHADIYDHAGVSTAIARPWFRDLVSNGLNYFTVKTGTNTVGYAGGSTGLGATGIVIITSANGRMESSWTDSILSANSGNTDWTIATVVSMNSTATTSPAFSGASAARVQLSTSLVNNGTISGGTAGNFCVSWATYSLTNVAYCTNSAAITTGAPYFLAASARAVPGRLPIITLYVATGGTVTQYGGVELGANGATGNGMIKLCSSTGCSAPPAVTSQVLYLGDDFARATSLAGVMHESMLYSGVVPPEIISKIYATMRRGWARTGRCTVTAGVCTNF